MISQRIARRYARALILITEENNLLNDIGRDLSFIRGIAGASRGFELLMTSPVIRKDKKRKILRDLLKGKVHNITYNFMLLLLTKGREKALIPIIDQYENLVDEKLGIVRAEIKAAVKIEENQLEQITGRLEEYTGKKLVVRFSLDKRLIGGFTAKIGDTIIDASLRRQLDILQDRFTGNGISN